MKWGIRTKLLAGFSLLLACTALVGGIGISQTDLLNQQATNMYADDLTGTALVGQITEAVLLNRQDMLALILTQAPARRTALENDITALDQKINDLIAAEQQGDSDGLQRTEMARFTQVWQDYQHTRDTVTLPASRSGKTAEAFTLFNGADSTSFAPVSTALEALITSKANSAAATNRKNQEIFARANQLIIGLTLAAVLIGLGIALYLARNIARAATQVAAAARGLAQGDLDQHIEVRTNDELGDMAEALRAMIAYLRQRASVIGQVAQGNLRVAVAPQSERDVLGTALTTMVTNLRGILQEIHEASTVLAASAAEIVTATTQVAAGATETATAVSQTTTTVEEVKQTAILASEKARQVAAHAQHAAQVSQTGTRSVDEAMGGMERIRDQMEQIAESIVRLSEQGQAIGAIIASVNDLAEQSNLLAVNAAIEAAKAGEAGRGFGVVAGEVKNLAEQSKQATAQVRSILNDIQRATSTAVQTTEQGSKAVEAGTAQSGEAGEAIRVLAESIDDATNAATQIAASSQQQLIGMDQVASAMENIKQASTQNVASTRQVESAAQRLHELGQKLRRVVAQYQV
jgi:methyl-accepting chemotaxis protein